MNGNKIKIFSATAIILILLMPMKPARAVWLADYDTMVFKQQLENIQRIIDGSILNALKQQMAGQIKTLVDSSTRKNIIANPEQFIFMNASRSALLSTTDLLTYMAGGRTADYVPIAREGLVGGSSSWNGSYATYLNNQGLQSIQGAPPRSDILNYVSNPSNMFATGNWRAFSSFISNPANNPFGVSLAAQSNYISAASKYTELNKTLYNAGGGFAPVTNNGQIVTPGSTVRDIQSGANNLGNQIIASATYKEEVIMGLVNRMVTGTMGGIGTVSNNSAIQNYSRTLQSIQTTNPASQYEPPY
jgi:hypothetical protein